MDKRENDNLHIVLQEELPSPRELKDAMPVTGTALETVLNGHKGVKGVLDHKDHRLLVVVGPCSIHNVDEAMAYARLLKPLADELSDTLLILMRVYFEKPRTTVGWEGLIYDPHLDGSHRIEHGLRIGQMTLLCVGGLLLYMLTLFVCGARLRHFQGQE